MKVKLMFDGPGWGNIRRDTASTWIRERINGRLHQTTVRYGEMLEADLEDGSLRSQHLKQQLDAKTCRIMKDGRKQPPPAA